MAAKQNQTIPDKYSPTSSSSPFMTDRVFTGDNTGLSQTGTQQALLDAIKSISSEEMKTANPNIKGNPLYGFGNPALSYDGSEYPYDPEADERIMPENQDTLAWHFYGNPADKDLMDFHFQATPEQKDQLAREFTLLRNASDYAIQQSADRLIEEKRRRDLYGDTLVDLLQNTPQGQSILGTAAITRNAMNPEDRFISRQRNITGPGTGGFIK